jgi:hypothetical protein
MRRFSWITVLFAAALSLGCVVPSLHPLFSANDLVFDPQLIGTWIDDDETLWMFERSGKQSYRAIVSSSKELSVFEAHLLELGPHRFLDLLPREEDADDTFRGLHLVRAHTFSKIEADSVGVRLVALSPDWLEESLTRGRLDIAHARVDGHLVLTASTPALQEFVLAESETSLVVDLRRASG